MLDQLCEESRTNNWCNVMLNSKNLNELKQEKKVCDDIVEKFKTKIKGKERLEEEHEEVLKRYAKALEDLDK